MKLTISLIKRSTATYHQIWVTGKGKIAYVSAIHIPASGVRNPAILTSARYPDGRTFSTVNAAVKYAQRQIDEWLVKMIKEARQ